MNRKTVINILSKMMLVESALMLVPALVSLFYKEHGTSLSFLVVSAGIAAIFVPIMLLTKNSGGFYAREAFAVTALCWVFWSAFGAIPFMLCAGITDFFSAFFEAVSAFTTTGATVFADVESLSHGILFWRSLMHWVGGMGVLVFALALLPITNTSSYMNLFRAEMTGSSVGKLVPKAKQTAFILYGIYFAMTLLLAVLLILGGMPVFDSINHAMSTAGTGGMTVKNSSIAYYDSAYIDIVITVFMLLFGVNFSLYFLALKGRIRDAVRSSEMRLYFIIFAVITLSISLDLTFTGNAGFLENLRHAAFQTSTLMSSTGFMSTDFDLWPMLSKVLLLTVMVIGACAGSTGGGIKVSRVQIAGKTMYRDVKRQVSPRFVYAVRSEGKVLDSSTVSSVMTFIVSYAALALITVLVLSFENISLETSISASVSALSNIGPAFDELGPTCNYMFLNPLSKMVLSADMLLGRLEIFPFLILFSRGTISKKYF